MAYTNETIADIVEKIENKRILLPAIQRKFVWKESQIEKLMDSIMCGYPFGSFLFWKVKKTTINEKGYPTYEFIREFHERDRFENPRIGKFTISEDNRDDTVYTVLDGQQRLTSLYIALKGSLSMKMQKKRWTNDDAFPKKKMYFNLLSEHVDDEDITYEFKFLTAEEIKVAKEDKIWFEVGDILTYSKIEEVDQFIDSNEQFSTNSVIKNNLRRLFRVLKDKELISYFEIDEKCPLDEVLDIFVRVNSGGTVLSKTDLLFSTITAQWQEARDEIDAALKEINGATFRFKSDFITRSCLYVLDMPVALKVENFGSKNVNEIRENWDKIKGSIKETTNFLKELGFSDDNITSTNAILPMIYYRYKHGKDAFDDDENEFRKYLVVAQLKQIFGVASSNTLDLYRKALGECEKEFKLSDISDVRVSNGNSLKCDRDDIENWMDEYRKGKYGFMILSLLEPDLHYKDYTYEQDHLHPNARFNEEELRAGAEFETRSGLSDAEVSDWIDKSDKIPNLHFLTPKENEERQDTPLKEWLEAGGKGRNDYLPNVNLDFDNFPEFFEKRREILIDELCKILGCE